MEATALDHVFKIIFYFPASIVISYFMARTLRVARPKLFILLFNLFQFSFYALFAFVLIDFSWGRTLNTFVQSGVYVFGALLFGRESIFRRCLSFALSLLSMMLAEMFSMILFSLAGGAIDLNQIAYATRNIPLYVCYQSVNFVCTSLLVFLFIQLWDRLIIKTSKQVLWYYFLFPVSQCLLLGIAIVYISITGLSSVRYALLTFSTLFCLVVDVFLFRSMQQLTQKAVAEERAAWSESLLLQQESHYAQIIADAADAAQIRHDIRNQLQTAYALISQGDPEAAKSQLDGISHRLSQAPTFCAHKVVNALLAVKAERFRGAQIEFVCDCVVPASLPLEGVELCSLFSNLLDNAYQSTVHCPGTVTLTAFLNNGYFIVKCQNPVDPTLKPVQRKGHGLGLTILQDMADRHEGALEAKSEAGQYTTTLWLKIEQSASPVD